jgi:hypothetical protein
MRGFVIATAVTCIAIAIGVALSSGLEPGFISIPERVYGRGDLRFAVSFPETGTSLRYVQLPHDGDALDFVSVSEEGSVPVPYVASVTGARLSTVVGARAVHLLLARALAGYQVVRHSHGALVTEVGLLTCANRAQAYVAGACSAVEIVSSRSTVWIVTMAAKGDRTDPLSFLNSFRSSTKAVADQIENK